jgi:uncharacterized membrane protein YcaP (DUF421 family)
MGKSAIATAAPYDPVAIVIIGTVAAEPLISTEVETTMITLAILTLIYLLFAKLTFHPAGNRLFLGKPTMKHGQIIEDHLEKSHLSPAQPPQPFGGNPDAANIDYAILELIGAISIIPKPEASPPSSRDIGLSPPYEELPAAVVIDGRIQRDNLELIHRDESGTKSCWKHTAFATEKDDLRLRRERSEELTSNLLTSDK